jgi:hypothetical protein
MEIPGARWTLSPRANCPQVAPWGRMVARGDLRTAVQQSLLNISVSGTSSQVATVNQQLGTNAAALATFGWNAAALSTAATRQLATASSSIGGLNTAGQQLSTRLATLAMDVGPRMSTAASAINSNLSDRVAAMPFGLAAATSRALVNEAALGVLISSQLAASLQTANSTLLAAAQHIRGEASTLRANTSALRDLAAVATTRASTAEVALIVSTATAASTASARLSAAVVALSSNFTLTLGQARTRASTAEANVEATVQGAINTFATSDSSARVALQANLSGMVALATSRAVAAEKAINASFSGLRALYNVLPTVNGILWAWHDGSDPDGNGVLPPAQANVISWADKGTNDIDINSRMGGVASDIVYRPNMRNGRGAIVFTGGAYALSTKQTSTVFNNQGLTWFVVYRTSPDTSVRSLASLLPTGPPYGNWYMATGGTSERWECGDTPRADTMSTLTVSTWVVSVGRCGTTANGPTTHRHANTIVGSATPLASDTMAVSSRGLQFGAYSGANHNGVFAESIIYNSYLSDADTQVVYNWLRAKWAI